MPLFASVLIGAYKKVGRIEEGLNLLTKALAAVEKSGWFPDIRRTMIGSPYVVASMIEASFAGCRGVVGYEANGGFLTNSAFSIAGGKELRALPTRDAVLPILSVILLSIREKKPISALLADLPQRFTAIIESDGHQ